MIAYSLILYCYSENDTVTMGLNLRSLEEYYNEFYMLNPLYNSINVDNLENHTNDLFLDEDFKKSEFYKKFFKKYGSFYLLSLGMTYKEKLIGFVTFMKTQEEGDFKHHEIEELKNVRDLVGNELMKVLVYENLSHENRMLKESERYFPIAEIVLDSEYNVRYNNSTALKYTKELTSSHLNSFKYFVINDLIVRGKLDTDKKLSTIEHNDFIISVTKKFHMSKLDQINDYFYEVYFVKKPEVDKVGRNKKNDLEVEPLTKREKEVASLIKEGLSNDEITKSSFISPLTVKTHVQRIYDKLDVSNRSELMFMLFEHENII